MSRCEAISNDSGVRCRNPSSVKGLCMHHFRIWEVRDIERYQEEEE